MDILKYTILLCYIAISSATRKNVLFLVSDDMRPELTSYLGPDFPSPTHPKMHSPNLDALAAKSLLLKRAYVQQAVCSPSRTSLLTGRRPDTTHVYDLVTYFRTVGGNFTTIPQYFKENGYASIGMGKIFHPGMAASGNDDPISWSEPYWHSPTLPVWDTTLFSWQAVDVKTEERFPLPDSLTAQHAVETLHRLAPKARSGEQPFFLAVGFHRPHLPFIFPERFLDFYLLEDIHIPDNEYAPINMPKVAWSAYGELRGYGDIHKLHATGAINSTLPAKTVRDLRRAYYSALSFTDSLVGQVMTALKEQGLENDTIVSFWGDHGWQLGEHGEWCKHTNFDIAAHAPMMVHVPGKTDQGMATEQLTEFVDLFPTLVEAAGLPSLPICPENSANVTVCREGRSLFPLMVDPTRCDWKDRVFHQYPRDGTNIMGYSMHTRRYHYTEWAKFHGRPIYKPDWSKLMGVELYDRETDPEENNNVADDPAYHVIKQGLSDLLHTGWRPVNL